MAIGKASDFKIRDDLFSTIFVEQMTQNAKGASEQSRGAIQIVTEMLEGDYARTRFFDRLTGGITRRDTTDVTAAADLALTQDENISVKRNFIFGPYAQTLDAFEKAQISSDQMTENLAVIYADELAKTALNAALESVAAALSAETATLVHDYTGTGNLAHAALVTGRGKMGDAFGRIRAWVGHSKAFHDLTAAQLSVASGNVADFVVYEGGVGTLGLPFFVTDSDALIRPATPTAYCTLGLVENAVTITMSESQRMVVDVITGLKNIVQRVQGEGAYNIGVKGYQWNVSAGGANPTDNTIATASNWTSVVASHKDKAGVYVLTT